MYPISPIIFILCLAIFQWSFELEAFPISFPGRSKSIRLADRRNWSPPQEIESDSNNGFSYSVELPKRAGINWASDISFRWIYVLDLEPNGAAAQSGVIEKVAIFNFLIIVPPQK